MELYSEILNDTLDLRKKRVLKLIKFLKKRIILK